MTDNHSNWRYLVNHGPDGEQNWANVYTPSGEMVGNLRIHHAIAIVDAGNATVPEPQWTERIAHVERRTSIEHQAGSLKAAIERLGAHPLLTSALNAADLAMRTLGQWHDLGEPGGSVSAVDAEVERILTMSEEQLYAEASSRGEDPARTAAYVRSIAEKAMGRKA